jgi:hypothetical protein
VTGPSLRIGMQAMRIAIARIGMISIGFTIGHLAVVSPLPPPHTLRTAGFPNNDSSAFRFAGETNRARSAAPPHAPGIVRP